MADPHFLSALDLELDFAGFPQPLQDEELAGRLLADFARGPLARVADATFDGALPADEIWRLDRLHLDLGDLTVEDGRDWPATVADAFARRLSLRLAELREGTGDGALSRQPGPVLQRRAQLEHLLYFLRHGHMPWYAQGRHAGDPRALGHLLLKQDARGLAAALRASPDRALILRRLAAQFEASWLQSLVQALLPDDATVAWRVLHALRDASPTGQMRGADTDAELWEAALEGVFARASGASGAPEHRVMRLQLKRALDAGASLDDAAVARTAGAWRTLLREDRAWLRMILQRHAGAPALQRRLVRVLPTGLLAQMAGLWLDGRHSQAVAGWIAAVAAVAAQAQALTAQVDDDVRRALWEATLSQLLGGHGGTAFDGRRFAREVRERVGLASTSDVQVDALLDGERPTLAELDAERWERLRRRPNDLRDALRRAVHEGQAARLVQHWPDALLLEAASLQWPEARPWIAAAVTSPSQDATTRTRRWISTLERFHRVPRGQTPTAFDPAVYLEDLVHEEARHAGIEPAEAASRWSDDMHRPAAEASWIARIVDTKVAAEPARAFARKVAGTVAAVARSLATSIASSIASSVGKRLGRRWSPPTPEPTPEPSLAAGEPALAIDNAGLVLLGQWMPTLFSRLGLLRRVDDTGGVGGTGGTGDSADFIDETARARAVHLLQFAVSGLDEPAPESSLVLNKLYCGLAPHTPMDRHFQITPGERAAVEELLGAVLGHWRTLGGTSIEGLRETFLRRAGRLEPRLEGGWTVAVDPGPFDILLDQLPWGYGLQKLPWMEEMLHVSWR